MRIAFLDPIGWAYTADAPYEKPLGGSQSALCYIAEQLAARGHDVAILNDVAAPTCARGVPSLPRRSAEAAALRALDALVVLNDPRGAAEIEGLARGAKRILWIHNATTHYAMDALRDAATRERFDAFVFVSEWQRETFQAELGLDPARCTAIGNGVAPAFLDLFAPGEQILAAKPEPKVIAYTSTPFRGLDRLVAAFPYLRALVPGTRLRVFSSMGVYQQGRHEDEALYGELYARCRDTEGIDYVGSVPQPELARELRRAHIFAYPTHFPETFCISMCEAMAAGCRVITTRLAALPETAGPHAALVDVRGDDWSAYLARFVSETARYLTERPAPHVEAELQAQVAYVQTRHHWRRRATQWEELLARGGLPAPRA